MLIIAVHGGAGDHSPSLDKHVKAALKACVQNIRDRGRISITRSSCTAALDVLISGTGAAQTVVEAISILEDDPVLNAGAFSFANGRLRSSCI